MRKSRKLLISQPDGILANDSAQPQAAYPRVTAAQSQGEKPNNPKCESSDPSRFHSGTPTLIFSCAPKHKSGTLGGYRP